MSTPRMEIYQFEDQGEKAVASWLLQNGVNDVKKQREHQLKLEDGTPIVLRTPRVEVKFLFGGFAREHYWINTFTKERWLDIGSGILYLKVVTRRDASDPTHAYLRGQCRWLMQNVRSISAKMQFHKIEKMIEQSSTVTFEADKIHDVSALSFQTDLRILETAFPQS